MAWSVLENEAAQEQAYKTHRLYLGRYKNYSKGNQMQQSKKQAARLQ